MDEKEAHVSGGKILDVFRATFACLRLEDGEERADANLRNGTSVVDEAKDNEHT